MYNRNAAKREALSRYALKSNEGNLTRENDRI
jgi:hypothetical protein